MRYVLCSTLLLSIAASSCGESDSETSADNQTAVSVEFAAVAGTESISCETSLTGLGSNQDSATLADFRFYIHDIVFTKDDGSSISLTLDENDWQTDNLALLDFQDKSDSCSGDEKDTHKEVTGTVSDTTGISGISFTLGVPEDLNHQDQSSASTPLNIVSLFWSWNSGYKFLRADVTPSNGITRPSDSTFSGTTFNIHIGSTACTGDATAGEDVTCTNSNRAQIALSDFELGTSLVTFDYATLVQSHNITSDVGGAPGCMSGSTDPECQGVFSGLGLDLSSGTQSTTTQTAFSLQ
ncbi:MbnP family copper-binding protein [Pseudobacteriovorax antillogorgiicola]|uniref:Methanobactin biosynthesis cassette protein MbnP n=1 Tax=Pseudobacteriovorax antillogorgiicola TaxID=1513793 RepID=A0A1Y6BY14_9BACT|nr:MbnP family copper-binding protein [Pseudobacteriovorax antillogorgiicola]TCS53016.1 methanobactin biosynthesis cassette protein MbnP [Pseudobacteriovorax antillogorgiicola]SMF26914.1 Methanobactin biosynthesis cassette protein MbnP [Pseudobacteriovorax antillogorgiicola]